MFCLYIHTLRSSIIFFSLFQSKEESNNNFEKKLKHAGADLQTKSAKAGIRKGSPDENKYKPDQNSIDNEGKDTKDT